MIGVKMIPQTRKPLLMILIAVFTFILATNLNAQTYRLTLEQAIGLGLENSTTLKRKMLSLVSARADIQKAKSSFFPSISAGATYSHLFDETKSPDVTIDLGAGPRTIPGAFILASDPIVLSADLSQPIYTFGRIKNGVKLAEVGLTLSQLDLDEAKRSLIVDIKRSFYGYILAKEVLRVQEETLQNKAEALEIARKRFGAGVGTELEVLSADSDVENFIPGIISARNKVEFALLAVIDLLGFEEEVEDFTIELIGELKPEYRPLDRKELISLATEQKFSIREFKTSISAAEYQSNLIAREKRPTIAGFANYMVQSGFDTATGKNKYTGRDSWEDNLTLGLSFQMPLSALLPWSGENADVIKFAAELESLKTGLQSEQGDIRLNIDNILLRIEEEVAKISSGNKRVELAQKFLESSEKSFANGLISPTDLKDAQLNLNTAQLGYLSAIFNYQMALYDLYDAVGVDTISIQ
jgi:HAE1 family hydrophobic/amphiphilic exporter-1